MTPTKTPDLTSLLEQPTAAEVEHQAKTEFDGVSGYIQTAPLPAAPTDHTDLLVMFGYDPESVEIVGNPHISRWQQRARDKDTGAFETVWLSAFKFTIRAKNTHAADVAELVDALDTWTIPAPPKKRKRKKKDPAPVFVWQVGDTQFGKLDGDGSAGTVTRFLESLGRAKGAYTRHVDRHGPSAVLIAVVGDCIEGNTSQGGRLVTRTDLTVTEQTRVLRRLLLRSIREFAPLTADLTMAVVNGNHDEISRQYATRADDGHATEAAIAVGEAIEGDDRLHHVRIQVPPRDQGFMTIKVADSVFTLTHGHQWRKGKAAEWWASHAYYNGAPAGANFLLHGHFHHTSVVVDGPRSILCCSTLDGGSAWFRDLTGAVNSHGSLAFTAIGPKFYDLEVV